jgi:carbonic anhydrase
MIDFPHSLLAGYRRFRANRYAGEHALYRSLAEHGQTPEVMMIACCDSRAAPDAIFDAAPGEIFVVRNVANLVPPCATDGACHSTPSALEYAVQSLQVRHIVVLGHGGCGGIQAALRPSAQPLSPDDFVGRWTSLLRPAVEEVAANGQLGGMARQTALERTAIRHSVANLRTFPFVADLEDSRRLDLHGAWFDIAEGELWTLNEATGEFAVAT